VALAYHGHLRDAYALVGDQQPALFVVLARFRGVPGDTACAVMGAWLDQRAMFGILNAHRYWAEEGDTVSLVRAVGYWDSLAATVEPVARPRAESLRRSSRACLALARRDTLRALRLLEGLPNWPNRYFSYYGAADARPAAVAAGSRS
jgi:hypothetical protein